MSKYLNGDGLKNCYSVSPDIDNVPQLIDGKKDFSKATREVLVNALRKQYSTSDIDLSNSLVGENIESLKDSNTYTITTGQQIHVGLGPLYVLYKILNVIQLSRDASNKYPNFKFVPVFWMATEDHDLEEIQTIHLFGKDFSWKTDQSGAVGRMNTDGISELIEQIENETRPPLFMKKFLDRCKKAYKADNLSIATRNLVHEYFAQLGLVLIDGDDKDLKGLFRSVMIEELQGKNIKSFESGTNGIMDAGFEPQIFIREINLFYLENGLRERNRTRWF